MSRTELSVLRPGTRRTYVCRIHDKRAYSEYYDSFFCPECYGWLEDECRCPPSEFALRERPATAKGLKDDL